MKDAAVSSAMESELLGGAVGDDGEDAQDGPDIISLFVASKQGWRLKPTTARRQERQLRALFREVSDSKSPSDILRNHLDDVERLLLKKVPHQTASVKSAVIALLEFERFASVREPEHAVQWDAARRRLQTWKRDASSLDLHREAQLQDKLGEDGYLPTREQLNELRKLVEAELPKMCAMTSDIRRTDAVKMRRLLTSAILLQNFQRSGVIKNARLDEYAKMKNEVLRVKDHKSNATYGSANLVVRGLVKHLEVYVEHFRSFLVTEDKVDLLFPSSDPADDIAEVCRGFQVDFKLTPTMIRKAASTAAYDDLTDSERRKLADHMTHRSATQFRAYSAKNRRAEATKTVQKMKQVLYGCDETTDTEDSEPRPAAVAFSSEEVAVLEKQVRKMISDGTFVSSRLALTMMSRNSPLFDSRSPKCVENKLRAMLQSAREKGRWDRYADERGGRSRRR
ncbi:uncharacterized protein LOC122373196 [Amphibalanus amphitrite]|nr:uncharacterized protein LOC122373196 [Amphibalanus amphitrite]